MDVLKGLQLRYILFICLFVMTLIFPSSTLAKEILTVGTIERVPFSYHDETHKLTGFSVELWEKIAKELKLEYTWYENKNLTELIGNVYKHKTDLAIANISVTSDRENKSDFSYSIFESGMAIAVKKGTGMSIWALVMDSGILTFVGIAFLVLLFVAHIIWFFERDIEEGEVDYFRDNYRHGIWDAFWWAFLVLVMGELEGEVSKRILNRIIAGIWIIVSLFFISTLTAKITTSMTISELKSGIQGYKDLSGKKVGVTQGSSHQKFLQKKGIKSIAYTSLEEMYSDLKNEKLSAIVSDFPLLSYYVSHQGAEWMSIAGSTFSKESYGIMFTEKSPYIEQVNTTLLKLKENGYYEELYTKYFGGK